jgi:hypothetical protein
MREVDRLFDGFDKKLATLLKTGVVSDGIERGRDSRVIVAAAKRYWVPNFDSFRFGLQPARAR